MIGQVMLLALCCVDGLKLQRRAVVEASNNNTRLQLAP
jgi:hypothetical protein